ncbi:MAG: RluA family pseudouridine synthase [bacterium]|nr:RluA family pseudouridine synthase [bacterium]
MPPAAPGSIGRHVFLVEASAAGRRLDIYLAERMPEVSRARLQALIAAGHVVVVGAGTSGGAETSPGRTRPADRVRTGDRVEVVIPPVVPTALKPEPIPLAVAYEDEHLLVVDKPAGMTVHPGAGRQTGTLVHAVLAHCPDMAGIGGEHRPGIVHRLDKDTSGLLVVAKNDSALRRLQAELQARRIRREYLALVHGSVARSEGTVDAPIGRDPRHRTRMAVVASGRQAVTHYRVTERFPRATLLEVRLETGRTHQIRVHCAHIGHPVVGDPVYARRPNPWGMRRQALHARRLVFAHPVSGHEMTFEAPLPTDLEAALGLLRIAVGDPGGVR